MQFGKINIPKKYIKIGAWVFGILLVLCGAFGAIAFTKREALLKKAIAKAIAKADQDYGLQVKIGTAGFTGMSTVRMTNISVVPKERDTLTTIANMTVGVKLMPLIFGDVKLAELRLKDGVVNVVVKDSLTNLDFILKRKKKDTVSKGKLDLAELAHNLLNQFYYKVPDNMQVNNLLLKFNDNDTAKLRFLTTSATIVDGDLKSNILVNDNEATWHVNGTLTPSSKQLNIAFFADKKKVELPYINNKLHAKVSFDTIRTEMKDVSYFGDEFKITGSWSVKNFQLNHEKIASNDILVPYANLDAEMVVGSNFVELDSTSTIMLKKATFLPEVHPFSAQDLRSEDSYGQTRRANVFGWLPERLV
jgi:hypothetical protein